MERPFKNIGKTLDSTVWWAVFMFHTLKIDPLLLFPPTISLVFESSSSSSVSWRHFETPFGSQACTSSAASTWFSSHPFSHVESAVTNTSALSFDWSKVCKARPRPSAVSQAVRHEEELVVVLHGFIGQHCIAGHSRRESTPGNWHWGLTVGFFFVFEPIKELFWARCE